MNRPSAPQSGSPDVSLNSRGATICVSASPSDVFCKSASKAKRLVDGVSQAFAVLPGQDTLVGASSVRQISFVMPMNGVGSGPGPREDGLLPTSAFERVFISYSKNYTALDPWR